MQEMQSIHTRDREVHAGRENPGQRTPKRPRREHRVERRNPRRRKAIKRPDRSAKSHHTGAQSSPRKAPRRGKRATRAWHFHRFHEHGLQAAQL